MADYLASVLRSGDLFLLFEDRRGHVGSGRTASQPLLLATVCHGMVWCGAAREDSTDSVLQFSMSAWRLDFSHVCLCSVHRSSCA